MLGWREWVALPDLAISHIKAKVDTGARTSALHAFFIEPYQARGRAMIRFDVHPYQGSSVVITARAPVADRRWVSDSGGHRELRYVIVTRLALGGVVWPVEMTLTNRDTMTFRMLLGRNALRDRFTVDPGRSYLVGKPPAGRRHPQEAE